MWYESEDPVLFFKQKTAYEIPKRDWSSDVCSSDLLARPGWWFAPALLADVRPGMPAFDEETFGPLAALIRARDTADAIALANRSRYGLAASVWTADVQAAHELAKSLEVGGVFINATVRSDPRLPFGGVRRSGHGRELGNFGIREFVNVKTVWAEGRPAEVS